MDFQLNFKVSPADNRDYVLTLPETKKETSEESPLKSTLVVDLSKGCTSIKNQGSIGSCTAHAGVALLEYNYRRFTADAKDDVFSERFTYYTTRVNVAKWSATADSGAFLRDTLKSLVQYGACLEESCPYDQCTFDKQPSANAYKEALKYQALTYMNIPVGSTLDSRKVSLATLKSVLQKGYPFIGGFTCYSNLFDGLKGFIPLPKDKVSSGGHAVCFVGYDDSKQAFKFKNSWGASWGDNGYGYLPYQYLFNGDLNDLWTIYTQENNDSPIGVVVKPLKHSVVIGDSLESSLEQLIANGLVAISQNQTPIVPVELPQNTKVSLQGFFNRIIIMKGQIK